MHSIDSWRPTKFEVTKRGQWRASRSNVPLTSRLMADLEAAAYSNAISKHAKGRLADLGCGNVPLFKMYHNLVSEVICVDWQSSLHQSKHVDIFADLNEPINIGDETFDTVIASDVIEHLHSPQALFNSAARALKPGGKLIIGVPFLYWIHEAPHDFHRYTEFSLERMSKLAGLQVIDLSAWGGAPEVLTDIATKALAPRPRVAKAFYCFSRLLLGLNIVKKLSTLTRATMPMGYLLVAAK